MVSNCTNINKTNNHLSSQIIENKKGSGHMVLEIQVLAWDRCKKVAGIYIYKPVNWMPTLLLS